jgi:tight adherence protein B
VSPDPAHALAPAVAAAASGDDVPSALRAVSVPGAGPGLARLAAAWWVADLSGAPLADVLDRLDADLGAARRRRDSADAHTAATVATVRLLSVLPLLGLGVGYALGSDPVHVLFHTGVGMACACVALALQVTGLLWAERIAGVDRTAGPATVAPCRVGPWPVPGSSAVRP